MNCNPLIRTSLMSIDGIVKIVPISVDEWIVVSPTGIYKYVVSINTTKRS